ncbi:MAG TPA: amino acid permease, partial [Ktedonobacteraceae bacterium]
MSVQTSEKTPTSTSPRLGRPILTTWEAIAQSLAIGPIFSVAFVSTLVVSAAGSASLLAVLLAGIGMLAVGWIITLYARRYAGAGAIYDYARHISPSLGLFAAVLYFVGILVLGATGGYTAAGLLASQFLQQLTGLALPWWVVGILLVVIVFVLNYFGVRLTTRVQLVLTGLSILPFLLLAIVIIAQGGASGNTPFFIPNGPPTGLFQGTLFAITLFVGFEAAASLGEETANPRKSIPRAITGTVIIAAILYLVVMYAAGIGFGSQHFDKWISDPAFIDTLATRYVGSWLAVLIDLAVLLDVVVSICAFSSTTARGIFALARHGFLPASLARTASFRSRPSTPFGGNLFILICAILVVAFVALTNTDPFSAFGITAAWGTILISAIYVVLVIGTPFIFSIKWWQWVFFVIALAAPALGIYGSVVPFPQWPMSLAVYGSSATIVLALVWIAVLHANRPALLAEAAKPHVWEESPEETAAVLAPESESVASELVEEAEPVAVASEQPEEAELVAVASELVEEAEPVAVASELV